MMLGLVLLYVGAVLFLNGLWLLGRIGDREIAVINVFTGGLTLLVALYLAFGPGSSPESILAAAQVLLFSFTYFWVAINRYNGADGRGLGWYCLFVALTAAPIAYTTLAGATSVLGVWLGLNWAAWAVLWFLFFLLLALKKPILRVTGAITAVEGVLTAWLPGYLLLTGVLR
ncbi:MAG TPA: AmiS/UreI family transporter [Thermodesulfobacteriota bacterium]